MTAIKRRHDLVRTTNQSAIVDHRIMIQTVASVVAAVAVEAQPGVTIAVILLRAINVDIIVAEEVMRNLCRRRLIGVHGAGAKVVDIVIYRGQMVHLRTEKVLGIAIVLITESLNH